MFSNPLLPGGLFYRAVSSSQKTSGATAADDTGGGDEPPIGGGETGGEPGGEPPPGGGGGGGDNPPGDTGNPPGGGDNPPGTGTQPPGTTPPGTPPVGGNPCPGPPAGGCPPNTNWDELSCQCIPQAGSITDTECGPGKHMDITGNCVPDSGTTTTSNPPGQTGNAPNLGGNVSVVVNNTVNLTEQAVDKIASAVSQGIQDAAQKAADIAKSALDAIKQAIKDLANAVWQGIQAALKNIWQIIQDIGSQIGNIVKNLVQAVSSAIEDAVKWIGQQIGPLITKVFNVLDTINQEIQKINDTILKPILTFYNTTVVTIATLTQAIEKDLHSGLSGILAIPEQLAGAMNTLDATMQRTVEQLGIANAGVVNSTWAPLINAQVGTPLGNIDKSLANFGSGSVKTTFTTDAMNLPDECNVGAVTKTIQDFQDAVTNSDSWWAKGIKLLLDGVLSLEYLRASLEQQIECYGEQARIKFPITKLDPGTALAAYLRGFITSDALTAELATKGYDATRIKALMDLQVMLVDINTAVDWWFKGVISDEDLANNITQHGGLPSDVDAYKSGSLVPFDINTATEMYKRGILDEQSLGKVYTINRLTQDEQAGRAAVMFTPRTLPSKLSFDRYTNLPKDGFNIGTYGIDAPAEWYDTAKQNGIGTDEARAQWMRAMYVPQVQQIVQSYFRGYRTLTEVQAVFYFWGIPQELHDELIQIQRPLIPFRQLGTYMKAGVMDDTRASNILSAHGFALSDIQLIMESFKGTSSSTSKSAASAVHTLSIGNARTLFEDKAITETQYESILVAHGYTQEMAAAQVSADTITAQIKQRKQTLADLTAEVEVSTISIDDAIGQLQTQGFTAGEIAKFQQTVQRATTAKIKTPSVSELEKFYKAQIITASQFHDGLIALGWQEPWVSAWMQLDTVQTPPPAPGTGTGQ